MRQEVLVKLIGFKKIWIIQKKQRKNKVLIKWKRKYVDHVK
jgi:hypothetical protein